MTRAGEETQPGLLVAVLVLLVVALCAVGWSSDRALSTCEKTHTKDSCYAALQP